MKHQAQTIKLLGELKRDQIQQQDSEPEPVDPFETTGIHQMKYHMTATIHAETGKES